MFIKKKTLCYHISSPTYIISKLLSLFFNTTSFSLDPDPDPVSLSSILSGSPSLLGVRSSCWDWDCSCQAGIEGGTMGRLGEANCFRLSSSPLIESRSVLKAASSLAADCAWFTRVSSSLILTSSSLSLSILPSTVRLRSESCSSTGFFFLLRKSRGSMNFWTDGCRGMKVGQTKPNRRCEYMNRKIKLYYA